MPNSNVSTALLADHPDLVPTLSRWFHREWGHISADRTPERYARLLGDNLNRDQIPLTVIAFEGTRPVGTASLDVNDLDDQDELSPWLASVVVEPDCRGKGLGTALIRRIEDEAKRLGVKTLYLWTEDADALYVRLGWKRRQTRPYRDVTIVVMEKNLEAE